MTREEAIEDIKYNIKPVVGGKSLDMAIQALTAISELSKRLKSINRYEMDENVLIGFNMAVAMFNEYFGEVGEKDWGGRMTNEEAIKKLKSFCHNCNKYPQCVNTDRECFEALDMAVQALTAEKTAEWTKDDECSNCGKYVYVGDRGNYCPNCGAKMEESGEK